MRIIGWTSETHAAAFCVACAKARWTSAQRERGQDASERNLHPIFDTDISSVDGWSCDDCYEPLDY